MLILKTIYYLLIGFFLFYEINYLINFKRETRILFSISQWVKRSEFKKAFQNKYVLYIYP